MNPLDMIMKFFFDNIFVICMLGACGYFVWQYLNIKRKMITKPINRSEIERLQFIERMKHNSSNIYKWLYRGNRMIGRIVAYRDYFKNPSNIRLADLVIKPILIWKITNPFAKSQAFQLYLGELKLNSKLEDKENIIAKIKNDQFQEIPMYHVEKDEEMNSSVVFDGDRIIIPEWVAFDYYFGVYYSMDIPKEHLKNIKDDNVIRTDLNELASVYYCKSQEQSTFDPIRAHQMALEEKRIELELAKAKGKVETI